MPAAIFFMGAGRTSKEGTAMQEQEIDVMSWAKEPRPAKRELSFNADVRKIGRCLRVNGERNQDRWEGSVCGQSKK